MGRLIIDGTSVFEIDEECLKKRNVPKECDISKYLEETSENNNRNNKKDATE